MENNVSKTVFVRLAGMWNSGEQMLVQRPKSLKRVANAINTPNLTILNNVIYRVDEHKLVFSS